MKSIIALIAAGLFSLALGQHSEAPVKIYPMRNIPQEDPRFKAVLDAVVAEITRAEREANPFLKIRILQSIAPGEFLVMASDQRTHMIYPGVEFPDDTVIHGHLEPRKELYRYKSVLGAPITVASANFQTNRLRVEIAPESFIARLQAGEFFEITKGTYQLHCKLCVGSGKMYHNTTCRECEGEGKFTGPQRVRIQW